MKDNLQKFCESLEQHDIQSAQIIFEKCIRDWKHELRKVFPLLSKYLSSEYENDEELFEGCLELINKLAAIGEVKDILLLCREEIELSKTDSKFVSLLFPALKALKRLPTSDMTYLFLFLSSIQSHLQKIDVHEENGEIADEINLRVDMIYSDILCFYDQLIPYYSEKMRHADSGKLMGKYLICLLGKPLGYLDLTLGQKKSRIRKITENIMKKISKIISDPFYQLEQLGVSETSYFAYGIFFYLVIYEGIENEMIPKVYDYIYICYSSLNFIIELLRGDSLVVLQKGLSVTETILSGCTKIPYFFLELEINKTFCEVLENIIVFNPYKNCRKQALKIFQLYLRRFEVKGQYLLLCNLLNQIKHSGLVGVTIIYYKEILVDLKRNCDPDLKFFEGDQLHLFINLCCDIPYDNTNILKSSDAIISLLNLMRFSVLQENLHNFQNLKEAVKIWRKKYLDPLQTFIKQCKNDFKEKSHQIEQDKKKTSEDILSVSVGGETIVSRDLKKNLDINMIGIEMIESLLERLVEILEERNLYN